MDQSKFINKETTEYVKAMQGQTADQRVDEVMINLENILTYLKDFETYVDASQAELQKKIDQQELQQIKSSNQFNNIVADLQSTLDSTRLLTFLATGASIAALVGTLWLAIK